MSYNFEDREDLNLGLQESWDLAHLDEQYYEELEVDVPDEEELTTEINTCYNARSLLDKSILGTKMKQKEPRPLLTITLDVV